MKWFFILLGIGVGLWLYLFPSYSWHQKMTVEVEVDGQLYSGFSVVGVSTTRHPDWLPVEGSYDSKMWGEAVVLELPENRYLFALIQHAIYLAPKVFQDKMDGSLSESGERWARIISNLREERDIASKDYPLLVTFRDLTDPKTVQKVDPENLAATFGSGVSLKRITLEITDEPVTEGKIGNVLGWLNHLKKYRTDPTNPFTNTLPKEIGYLRSKRK